MIGVGNCNDLAEVNVWMTYQAQFRAVTGTIQGFEVPKFLVKFTEMTFGMATVSPGPQS
jgi:hypothetical protein